VSAKIELNFINDLIYCEVITNSLGRKVYFDTLLDSHKDSKGKKLKVMDTGLGGCSSGPLIKNCKVIPDTFRISGIWTKQAFKNLIEVLEKSGAEIKTIEETI
jgi:hypothetical protein